MRHCLTILLFAISAFSLAEEFVTTGTEYHSVSESGVHLNGEAENGLIILRWRHPVEPVVDGVDQIVKTEVRILRENLGQNPDIRNEWLFDVNQTFYGHESREFMTRLKEYEGWYAYEIKTYTITGDVYITLPSEYNRFLVLPKGETYGEFTAGRVSTRGSFETTLAISAHPYHDQEITLTIFPDGGGLPVTYGDSLFIPEGRDSYQFYLSDYFGEISGSLVLEASSRFHFIDAVSSISSHLSPNATLQRARPVGSSTDSKYFVGLEESFTGETDGYWVQITNTGQNQESVRVMVNGADRGQVRVLGRGTELVHLTSVDTHDSDFRFQELVVLDRVVGSGAVTFDAPDGVSVTVFTLRGGEIVTHPGR